MENNNGNNTAFPSEQTERNQQNNGLTKREYFAGVAMQGLLSSSKFAEGIAYNPVIFELSIKMSDELLIQLSK